MSFWALTSLSRTGAGKMHPTPWPSLRCFHAKTKPLTYALFAASGHASTVDAAAHVATAAAHAKSKTGGATRESATILLQRLLFVPQALMGLVGWL
mmetsp:Transcript_95292/g.188870  ORF Transcript_95292/g.188870 Transcript_95292/m.188870 type:complete len:96 (+) Transcript_95292:416-703(+)